MIAEGMDQFADGYARGPERVQFLRKDPVGWAKFHAGLACHSAQGLGLKSIFKSQQRGVEVRQTK